MTHLTPAQEAREIAHWNAVRREAHRLRSQRLGLDQDAVEALPGAGIIALAKEYGEAWNATPTEFEAAREAVLGPDRCDVCGRRPVDGMSAESTSPSADLCWRDVTGECRAE